MTRAEIKEGLQRYGFDEDDPLDVWVNAALYWVSDAHLWPFLMADPFTVTVSAGNNTIVFPADFQRLVLLKDLTYGRKLKPMELTQFHREIDDEDEAGYPEFYILYDRDTVKLWRVPDTDVEMKVVYTHTIAELDDDADVPDLPSNLHYAIVQASAAIALQAENEEERATTAEEQFNNTVNRAYNMLSGAGSRDEPRTVTNAQGY